MRGSKDIKQKRRFPRIESLEHRRLLVSDLGVISGLVFVDQGNDGSPVGDPPVLISDTGNLVSPGTPGAQGIQIQLFNDDGSSLGVFDESDTLAGTATSDLTGRYRFDGLSPGTYFVRQAGVPQLITPAPLLVQVVNDAGVRTALIDDYSITPVAVRFVRSAGTPNDFVSADATEAIGGNRDISINAATGNITFEINTFTSELTVSPGASGTGNARVQYDGPENTATLDPVGLRSGGVGVSLGGGVPGQTVDPQGGIIARLRAENAGDVGEIIVHTDAGNSSIRTFASPQNAQANQEVFIPFSSFTINTGSGADFNNVGAIETNFPITVPNNDVNVAIFEAITPAIVTANFANIRTLSLGGQLFRDSSPGGRNDGMRQETEPGLNGVTVQLVDPTSSEVVATTMTVEGGVYNFPGLNPGDYLAVIPASQFAAEAPLFGFANSTGNDPAPDPDDNIDNDDNGTALPNGDVRSGTLTLVSNLEPINDGDTDPNTNNTLDFGFFPQVDLAIIKTVNAASSNLAAGGNVVFDIVVQNNGPLPATNVVVTDVFPAGLNFTGTTNAPAGAITDINGTIVTVMLGALAAGATGSFQFGATIGANQTADLTNTASVAGSEVETNTDNNSSSVTTNVASVPLLSGHVFCDSNRNGIEDLDERISNTRVFLDRNGNRRFDLGEVESMTDPQGNYAVTSVQSGEFVVVAEIPASCAVIPSNPGVVRTLIDAGNIATSIAAYDRDFDGDLDLVITSDLDGSLTTILNQSGNFTAGPVEVLGSRPQKVFAHGANPTVNGMLAVVGVGTGIGADQGSLHFGQTSLQSVSAASGTIDVLIDRFLGDDTVQIVTASFRPSTLRMISTDGSFAPREIPTTTSQLVSIASGDIDGDSHVDIVATGYGFEGSDSEISVLLGDGEGNFNPLNSTTAIPRAKYVAVKVVDIDSDGTEEIATVSRNVNNSSTVSVYRLLNGALRTLSQTTIAAKVSAMDLGNLDADSILDLVLTSESDNRVLFYRGVSGGGFELLQTVENVPSPSSVVIVDLESDRRSEVAVTNRYRRTLDSSDTSPLLPSTVTVLRLQVAQQGVVIEQAPVVADFAVRSAVFATRKDVNSDGQINANDAIRVINEIENRSSLQLNSSAAEGEQLSRLWSATDIDLDGMTGAVDALLIINHLMRESSRIASEQSNQIPNSMTGNLNKKTRIDAIDEVIAGSLF